MNKHNLMHKVHALMEGDDLPLAFNEIKLKIAQRIIMTQPDKADERERLYYLTQAVDELQMKLREYVHEIEKEQEGNDGY